MGKIHVQRLRLDFEKRFSAIDMSDYKNKPPDEVESVFLSRSLAAFACVALEGATDAEASDAVVDGYDDGGIDAIYYNEAEATLVLCQSKWKSSGTGSISEGELHKFLRGVDRIVELKLEHLNPKVKEMEGVIREAVTDTDVRIKMVLTFNGADDLSKSVRHLFDEFITNSNDGSELFSGEVLNQTRNYRLLEELRSGAPVTVDVHLAEWGSIQEPIQAFYGRTSARQIASWWRMHGRKLLTKNIRSFKGSTAVNTGIAETLRGSPEHFWYFNNGITLLCESIKRTPFAAGKREVGQFECAGASIVNGAQTVGQIGSAFDNEEDIPEDAQVLVRIISLENVPHAFGDRITRATNTQNRIESRDFAALDENQKRIHRELALDNLEYLFRSGDQEPESSGGFSVTEAAIAMACAKDLALAVTVKNQIGRLFEDITSPPYTDIFNDKTNPHHLWRAVRVMRAVDKAIDKLSSSNLPRAELMASHANRMVLFLTFQDPRLTNWKDLARPIEDIERDAETAASDVFTAVANDFEKNEQAYPQPFFKTVDKCRRLVERLATSTSSGQHTPKAPEEKDERSTPPGTLPFK